MKNSPGIEILKIVLKSRNPENINHPIVVIFSLRIKRINKGGRAVNKIRDEVTSLDFEQQRKVLFRCSQRSNAVRGVRRNEKIAKSLNLQIFELIYWQKRISETKRKK